MSYPNLSVTAPVEYAFQTVKRVLFQPFDISRWFVIGFCAWLAYLGRGGGGGGGGYTGPRHRGGGGPGELVREAREYIVANLHWLIPVAIAVILFSLALWILITWLSSRGRFMFLFCVATNRAEIKVPWARYAHEATSHFLFRIVTGLILWVLFLPFIIMLVFGVFQIAEGMFGVPFIVVGVLAILFLAAMYWLLVRFMTDFIVPLQYLNGISAVEAWRRLFQLMRGRIGDFVLYLLFRILLALAVGAITFALILVTCCVAGCLMAIPYIGTVLLLPILVFDRAYSAAFFAQLGPEYNVFMPPAEPVPA